jgi:putative inorganic carbon (HCO3(-)) transporter
MFRSLLDGSADRIPPVLAWLLGALVFFSTFSIAGTQTAIGLLVVLWLVLLIRGKAPRPRRTPLDLPIVIFVAAVLVAAAFSREMLASVEHAKNLLLFVVIYAVGGLLTDARLGRRLSAVLVFSGMGSSIYGIAIYLTGRGEGVLGRTPGSFSTPMTFGGVLLILCSISFAIVVSPGIGRRPRIAYCLATVASFVALLFTFTRSSWIGTVVSVAIVLAFLRRKLLIPFATALVVLFLLLPGTYRERIATMWSPTFGTNVQRLELLSGGWRIFKDHPIVGVGTMDLAAIYRQYKPPGAVFVHGHMHNNFLQIAVQMGVVGLAAFVLLLVAFFRLLVRNLKLDLALPERAWVVGSLGAFIGFLVNGLFDWTFGDAEIITLLYVVMGANLAISMRPDVFGSAPPRDRGGGR